MLGGPVGALPGADADLAAPAVVLPDFHLKGDKEMPSSIAVATANTIRPTFSSASLNCGMALVAIDMSRPAAEAVAAFYEQMVVLERELGRIQEGFQLG